MRVLIIGCGYVGKALGEALIRLGHKVHGIRRNKDSRTELENAGIQPLFADITQREQLNGLLQSFDWIINTTSSSRGGAEIHREVFVNGTRNLIDWMTTRPPQKFIFTSSTGVYGQVDGSLVNEDSPAEPTGGTGRNLLEAEKMVCEANGIVLRVSGIYGPQRGFLYRQYLKGEAVLNEKDERWLNMLHREDVVGAILKVLELAPPGEIFNATDNEPVTEFKFFEWLAEKLGRPMPPTGEKPPRGKRNRTNKRVENKRLKALGWQLHYPTFREGYSALID